MEDLFETNKSLLKSMLLDEGKLITYISVSKDLYVHVNVSKTLLQRLVEHVRQVNSEFQLNVCYILSGVTDNNNGRTIVCSEQELTKEKKCFKNIFFEHIYSVAKDCPSIDTAAYLSVNKFEDFVLCSGLIKSKHCNKRTMVEIEKLKSNSQEIIVPQKTKSLPAPSKVKLEADGTKVGHSEIKFLSREHMEVKSEPVMKQEKKSPKKETIGPVNNKLKANLASNQKTQKGIAGFFNKTNHSSNKMDVKEKLTIAKETKQLTEIAENKCEKMEIEQTIPVVNDKAKNKKESTNKSLDQIKRTSKVDKKRKRVLHVSDSESDNENNDPFVDECGVNEREQVIHESEDEIPPTPTATNIVIKSGLVNPRKRRKIVDKTYTDEDGYILTKKVEVYESCSENEEESLIQIKPPQAKEVKNEISPKEKTIKPKKKVTSPQKGKQSTLTNFFKKL